MAKPGPRQKPTALKRLQGQAGKANSREPRPANIKPRCPSHLSKEAKKEWRRVAKQLHDAGLLTSVDRGLLALYCQAYGRWVEAELEIQKGGMIVTTHHGNVIKSPWLQIADKSLDQIYRISKEFGLSPSSRAGLVVEDGRGKWSIADELMAVVEASRRINDEEN